MSFPFTATSNIVISVFWIITLKDFFRVVEINKKFIFLCGIIIAVIFGLEIAADVAQVLYLDQASMYSFFIKKFQLTSFVKNSC
jgi:hypothetical protein